MSKILIYLGAFVCANVLHHQVSATFELLFEPQDANHPSLLYVSSINDTVTENLEAYVEKFLKDYEQPKGLMNVYNCDKSTSLKPPKGLVCNLAIKYAFERCSRNNILKYGYRRNTPCAFLKFKTETNWIPEFYNCSTALSANIPKIISDQLCSDQPEEDKRKIWLSCDGAELIDKELVGPIWFSKPGFDESYLFNRDVDGWRSPLVAIQFQKPNSQGILTKVECKAWAKNINHKDGEGVLKIELIVY